jgi:hypothetical protein
VQELIDEHRLASCLLLPIDDTTWAIQGSIPYEGEVILAEFDDRGDALVALEQIAAAGIPVSMR